MINGFSDISGCSVYRTARKVVPTDLRVLALESACFSWYPLVKSEPSNSSATVGRADPFPGFRGGIFETNTLTAFGLYSAAVLQEFLYCFDFI